MIPRCCHARRPPRHGGIDCCAYDGAARLTGVGSPPQLGRTPQEAGLPEGHRLRHSAAGLKPAEWSRTRCGLYESAVMVTSCALLQSAGVKVRVPPEVTDTPLVPDVKSTVTVIVAGGAAESVTPKMPVEPRGAQDGASPQGDLRQNQLPDAVGPRSGRRALPPDQPIQAAVVYPSLPSAAERMASASARRSCAALSWAPGALWIAERYGMSCCQLDYARRSRGQRVLHLVQGLGPLRSQH